MQAGLTLQVDTIGEQLLTFCLLICPNEIDCWGNIRGVPLLSKVSSSPGSYTTFFLCEITQLCPNAK